MRTTLPMYVAGVLYVMKQLKKIVDILTPYRDVIFFMVALLASNYFWKYTVHGDEVGRGLVTWFGINLTPAFDAVSEHITAVVFACLSFFRDTIHQVSPVSLRFDSGMSIRIVWSCTALKQSFIWLCIMLAAPMSSGKLFSSVNWRTLVVKLLFIIFGWLCIYLFNILRITLIALLTEYHHEWFNLLHAYIFKYLFYIMLFLLWVLYVEKLRVWACRRYGIAIS